MSIKDFYRGNSELYELTITDSAGNPIDLTGCTIWFTMKVDPNDSDSDAAIQKIVTEHSDPTHGKTKVNLTAVDTRNLAPNKSYFYDFKYKNASGDVVKTLLEGRVKVLQNITQAS